MNIEEEMERVVHGGKTAAELREEEKKARMEELFNNADKANETFINEIFVKEHFDMGSLSMVIQNMADDGTLDKLLHEIGYQRASEHLCPMTPIN